MEFKDYKKLTDDEKQFWQFEQLSKISAMEKKINFIYIWATGVAAGVSFAFMLIKSRFFDK